MGRNTLKKMNKQQQDDADYIKVYSLYCEALLEKNQYKLDRVNEYYKCEKEVSRTTNIVMSVILFLLIDLFIGKKKDSMTLSCQLLNQLSVIDSNIIKLIIWGGIILFFYASILILIDGYHTMWNDLILYPRDKKNK